MNFLVCRGVMAYLVKQTQYMLEKTFTFRDNTVLDAPRPFIFGFVFMNTPEIMTKLRS